MMSIIKINSKKISGFRPTNSRFVLALFWIMILFQLTMFKHIWVIRGPARFFNLVSLLMVSVYAAHFISSHRFNKNVWNFYILPGLFVFFGIFLNIALNSVRDLKVMNYFGMMLPWAVYLAMPSLLKNNTCDSETLWRYFYYFMLAVVSLGLLEYFWIFSREPLLRIIFTPGGEFLAGSFSILYPLQGGSPGSRFYACFGEPGSLAMFLLPAALYAYYHKKYIGLVVFIAGLYFSKSFGGIIGVAVIIPLIFFLATNKRRIHLFIAVLVLILASSVLVMNYGGKILSVYEERVKFRNVRGDTFKNTMKNLATIIVNNPIGFKFEGKSASASKSKDYYGSNFRPGNALQMGGISAFLGYIFILGVSLMVAFLSIMRKGLSLEEKVVFCSLIVLFPFIFQREAVWDSAIFAFLFAPSIIRFLQSRDNVHRR